MGTAKSSDDRSIGVPGRQAHSKKEPVDERWGPRHQRGAAVAVGGEDVEAGGGAP